MLTQEWESINDELFAEAGAGECIQVNSEDHTYLQRMDEQNKKVLAFLKAKYPDREFRRSKWHQHEFGPYQEIEEAVYYEEQEDEVIF